jgi:hypothetical protein
MKSINKFFFLSVFISMVMLFSCQNSAKQKGGTQSQLSSDQHNFGLTITKENAHETLELPSLFVTDSVPVKLTGRIVNVCQHSGCWLTLAYGKEELMVNLKDQAFSVPKDISGKTAWVDGIAYRELIDVETLKQIADENGKSQEEIDAITQAVYDYTVEATGVIVE